MPIYEFRCRACGATVEELLPIGAPSPKKCQVCGGPLKKVYGRVGVKFEGWGFRSTDRLLPNDRPRKDFKKLREKAEEIAEG